MRYWSECGSFIREFRRSVRDTGALLPSSRFLARALVIELRKLRPAARILEVGPGTGSVTREILRAMQPEDRLDAVELNGHFISLLHKRFEQEPTFRCHRDQVELVHAPVQELVGDSVYDYIISGLPLNNFPVGQVRDIFRAYNRLLKPGGVLSYYEYVLIRQLKTPFVNRRERRRLYRVGRVVGKYIRAYQIERHPVIINVPPAVVRHLRLRPKGDASSMPPAPVREVLVPSGRA